MDEWNCQFVSGLKEHCDKLNGTIAKVEEEHDRTREQVGTLTRKLDKSRSQNAKLVEEVKESVKSTEEDKTEDNEMRDAELAELRKVREGGRTTIAIIIVRLSWSDSIPVGRLASPWQDIAGTIDRGFWGSCAVETPQVLRVE